jgi:hypothetical protein
MTDFDVLTEIATSGVTFAKKAALLTGVGKGSIGVEILKGLLSGGCTCVVTTSRYSRDAVDYYKNIFHELGSKGSKLIVVPFNGGQYNIIPFDEAHWQLPSRTLKLSLTTSTLLSKSIWTTLFLSLLSPRMVERLTTLMTSRNSLTDSC